jgi:hypothetical protein
MVCAFQVAAAAAATKQQKLVCCKSCMTAFRLTVRATPRGKQLAKILVHML